MRGLRVMPALHALRQLAARQIIVSPAGFGQHERPLGEPLDCHGAGELRRSEGHSKSQLPSSTPAANRVARRRGVGELRPISAPRNHLPFVRAVASE